MHPPLEVLGNRRLNQLAIPPQRPDEPLSPRGEILRRNLNERLLLMACKSGNRKQILLAITPIVIDDLIDRLTSTAPAESQPVPKDGPPPCRDDAASPS